MKILKKIAIGFIALIVVFAAIGLLIPRVSSVERSLVIQAPAEVIFQQVNDLKRNEAWSPWKDSTMKISYGPVTEGKGASYSWQSEQMGKGTQTIEESVPASLIKIDLDFGSMGKAKAAWNFTPEGDGVKVTQSMTSDAGMNPAKRWMSLLTDKMVGPFFEKGLASLKQVSETRAAEIQAEQAATMQAAAAPVDEAASAGAAAIGTPAASSATPAIPPVKKTP
jgi:hypothetical protein